MNSRDHFLHAIMFGGFALISGLTTPILAALGQPTGCIVTAIIASLCGSAMFREIDKGRARRRIENLSLPLTHYRPRGGGRSRRVAGNPLSYIKH